jgi:hypothetical protein
MDVCVAKPVVPWHAFNLLGFGPVSLRRTIRSNRTIRRNKVALARGIALQLDVSALEIQKASRFGQVLTRVARTEFGLRQ